VIEKMQFISITGPIEGFDDFLKNHLSRYEIHLTNAVTQMQGMKDLRPFPVNNKYKEKLMDIEEIVSRISEKKRNANKLKTHIFKSSQEVMNFVDEEVGYFDEQNNKLNLLELDKKALEEKLSKIRYFQGLDFDIEQILDFKNIKFRFGKIPSEYYNNFEKYVFSESKCLFWKCQEINNEVMGIYFCLNQDSTEVDNACKTLHFERFYMPDEFKGDPDCICSDIFDRINGININIDNINKLLEKHLEEKYEKLIDAKNIILQYSTMYDAGQMAALNYNLDKQQYIICGYISKKDAKLLINEIEELKDITYAIEEVEGLNKGLKAPPTKLKNARIFKPFESIVKMYGLPVYTEMDPTAFVALSYSFIFGAMFGDVGQGAFLVLLGLLLFFKKKMQLGAALSFAGVFSVFFGFMYGSVFGFENIINHIWLKPISAMTDLPILGRLNKVFVAAVIFGISLIFLSMIFNIINCFKNRRFSALLTGHNAFPGLVFYGTAIWILISVMSGNKIPMISGPLMLVLFVVPLLMFMFKEPIVHAIDKKPYKIESVGMFIVENFFEVFEILLSYFSNTLSFVRIGAFAVSHAAMMEVVMMLSGVSSGHPNIIGVIIGNIFICAMEGLIVGIQVLRLEYYELFSRFYIGGGKEFKPFFIKDNLGGIKE